MFSSLGCLKEVKKWTWYLEKCKFLLQIVYICMTAISPCYLCANLLVAWLYHLGFTGIVGYNIDTAVRRCGQRDTGAYFDSMDFSCH